MHCTTTATTKWCGGWRLFALLLAFRLVNVWLSRTYIDPDETWQSLEVAHRIAFGHGFLTWEWRYRIREYAFPLVFAAIYKVLEMLGLDNVLLLKGPYFVVAAITATFDYYNYWFIRRMFGPQAAKWGLVCSLTSWVMFGHFNRPLANSAEAAIVTAGFAFWPWDGLRDAVGDSQFRSKARTALLLASLSCIIRPTSLVIWAPLALMLLLGSSRSLSQRVEFVKQAITTGAAAVLVMVTTNRIGYGEWALPLYNFYKFNVADNLGEWFGVSSPLFHFVASVPVLFSILLPWIWYGVARAVRERNAVSPRDGGGYMLEPLTLAVVTTAIYSLPGHKEYRFLFPILPLGYLYAAKGLLSHVGPLPTPACLSGVLGDDHPDGTSKKDDDARPFPMPPEAAGRLMGGNASKARDSGGGSSSSRRSIPKALPRPQLAWRRVLAFLIAANLPVALYLALLHQSGVVKVMSYLRESASRHQVSSIGFLMPCHSTPFYSHFHHGLPMWFLSCDPYLKETPAELHRWEAQEFEEDPVGFMSLNLISPQNAQGISGSPDARYWPSHLVFFDNKSGVIRDYLKDRGYKECARFFNSLWLPDARRQGDVVVYCGPVTKASDS